MKTSDIRSMGLAYLKVLNLDEKAVNKFGHDPVGNEDPDVNNDKKVNSTDKYLLNRRKAISANIRKEETEEVDEALVGNQHKLDANKNGRVDAHDFKLLRKGKKVAEEKEEGAAHEKAEKKTVSAKSIKHALASAKAQAKPKSAVSLAKAPWNEEVEEVKEVSNASKVFNKIAAKAGGGEKGKKMAAGLLNKMKKEEVELDEVSANKLGKYSIAAAQQGDKRVAGQKMADEKIRKKYGYSSDAKVAAESTEVDEGLNMMRYKSPAQLKKTSEIKMAQAVANEKAKNDALRAKKEKENAREATEWPIFARIMEKANAMPLATPETKKGKYEISNVGDDFAADITTKGTKRMPANTEPPNSEKNFIDQHGGLNGNDTGHSQSKNAAMNAIAATAGVKQAPGRPNDQKIGDKTPPKGSA